MQFLRQWLRIAIDAAYAFNEDDGWALASHIALSALLALFPFLIVVTALAGYMGSKEIADNLADILLQTWPTQVAEPLAREIHNVLTTTRGDVLTVGVVLSVYFASSGVDSLRIALNRAYNVTETRSIWLLKLESIGYVLVAVLALLALGFLIVLAPLVFATWVKYAPWLAPLENQLTYWRYGIAVTMIVIALVVAHKWLVGGQAQLPGYRAGRDRHSHSVARDRHPVRPLSRRVRQQLRHDVCGARLGDDRAGVSVLERDHLRLRRRAQCRDPAPAGAQARRGRGAARRRGGTARAARARRVRAHDELARVREAKAVKLSSEAA